MKIYLDFDGTVVEHQYPKMGRCNFGCFEVIKKLQDAGHDIVLNTYRSDCNDGTLEQALHYINFLAWTFVNSMPGEDFQLKPIIALPVKVYPPVFSWDAVERTQCLFIDDQSAGMPLKPTVSVNGGVMVDWQALDKLFESKGLYNG